MALAQLDWIGGGSGVSQHSMKYITTVANTWTDVNFGFEPKYVVINFDANSTKSVERFWDIDGNKLTGIETDNPTETDYSSQISSSYKTISNGISIKFSSVVQISLCGIG